MTQLSDPPAGDTSASMPSVPAAALPTAGAPELIEVYGMAPLIRFTLLSLYAALLLPLPFLAPPAWREIGRAHV